MKNSPCTASSGTGCTLRKKVKKMLKRGRSWPGKRCCSQSLTKNLRHTSMTSTPQRKVCLFSMLSTSQSQSKPNRWGEWVNGVGHLETWLFIARSWLPTATVLELWDDTREPAEERGEVVQRLPGGPALQKPTWHPQPLWAQSRGLSLNSWSLRGF